MDDGLPAPVVPVPVEALARMAADFWRLRRDMAHVLGAGGETVVERRVRRLERALDDLGVRIWDPIGLPLDGGLAVDVVDRVSVAAAASRSTVHETLRPIVFVQDRLAARGEVIAADAAASAPTTGDPAEESQG